MKENTNWWEIFSSFWSEKRDHRSDWEFSSSLNWALWDVSGSEGTFPKFFVSHFVILNVTRSAHLKHLNALEWMTGQIHQSRLEYKLLLKVQMIGSKAGIIHRLFHLSELELIEIFNKTSGMWTWAEPRLANTLGYITRVTSDFTCLEPNQSDIS